MAKNINEIIENDDVVVVKKSNKRAVGHIIYYIFGICLSFAFLFPILYMIATSTKSQERIANDAGTLLMFLPDFSNIGGWLNNYAVIFGDYNVGRYALNSFIYAIIVIILNILINGMAAYAICKLKFPGKKFFNFIITTNRFNKFVDKIIRRNI